MPMKLGSECPSLQGATEWINAETAPECSGAPLLVHFWAVSCYVCKKNLPTLQQWRDEFAEKGLLVVAVHMPRQESDMDRDAVLAAIKEFGITEPCAIDNSHALRDAFQNDQGWVPAYFLFDSEGKLRSRAAGENGLAMLRGALERVMPQE